MKLTEYQFNNLHKRTDISFITYTNYGYLLLGSFLPFILYLFLKAYLNKKTALILLTSFIFIPILKIWDLVFLIIYGK